MKLSIICESRNPERPTDLSLVAHEYGGKDPRAQSHAVNFYSGKMGGSNEGKLVLGYYDHKRSFKITGRIVSIDQLKDDKHHWLVTTDKDGPYYYLLDMAPSTVMRTNERYLKRFKIPLFIYDQGTGRLVNVNTNANKKASGSWAYYDGSEIDLTKKPTQRPRTTLEAYDYLMLWAYYNHESNNANARKKGYSTDALIDFLKNDKRLHVTTWEIATAFPEAKEAVINKLRSIGHEENEPDDDEDSDFNLP